MELKNFKRGGVTAKQFSIKQRKFLYENPDIVILYYLPEDHYAGITDCKNFFRRMYQHRRDGHFTNGVEIISFYKERVFAHLDETKLHCIGYNGFRQLTRR
jgi:hypothetical protein